MTADGGKHAFISYVHEDAEKVNLLCSALEAAGIPYWRDVKDLWPGDQWKNVIRNAIRSGTLVFLACFSEQSRGREKSYQNEELYLAIEEMRQMPPGRSWLIPIRLDDGPVPDYDVRPGLTFADLNRIDFFGPGIIAASSRLTATINRLLGSPAPGASTVAAAIDESDPDHRTDMLRRTTKEFLPDPVRRIQLDDLVSQEVARILSQLRDTSRFPLQIEQNTTVEVLAQVARSAEEYTHLMAPLLASLQVAARWAEPAQLEPWINAIRTLAHFAEQPQGGLPALLDLRRLPVVMLIWTTAVSSLSANRWDNLRALAVDVKVPYLPGSHPPVPVLEAEYPWRAFSSSKDLANVVAYTALSGLEPHAAATAVADRSGARYRAPIPDWLYTVLKPIFATQFPEETSYAQAVDRGETALGVLSEDAAIQSDATWRGSSWFGRATYTSGWSHRTPIDDLADEAASQGAQWPPLSVGLFGGDPRRASTAIEKYREEFTQVAQQRG